MLSSQSPVPRPGSWSLERLTAVGALIREFVIDTNAVIATYHDVVLLYIDRDLVNLLMHTDSL